MSGDPGPIVLTLDARTTGAGDIAALREQARARAATLGLPHISRSYRFPYALIAGHDTPVGVDIERIEPPDERFARSICTPDELTEIDTIMTAPDGVASLWSSKEALSKALGDALEYDPRRLTAPSGWPDGDGGAWRARRAPAPAGHLAWIVWRARPG